MRSDHLQKELEERHHSGLYRELRSVGSPQSSRIILNGKEVLNFCSNDYLGLANDDRIKKAAVDAINEFGFGAGASRLICGNMGPHDMLEKEIAGLKDAEAALVYSSGYMANTGIIPALMDRDSVVLSDRLNHASIIDGVILSRARLLRYPHADMQALGNILKDVPAAKRKMIVTDTVFSMDGDKAPLKEIVRLAQKFDAMVMVDEAHAFGVLGQKGGGLVDELGLSQQVDIQMGTLSKAAGCFGAYVCGEKILREYLINQSRSFIYTTAMPPALAQAARTALKIIREEEGLRLKVKGSSDYLRATLGSMGFDWMNSSTPIIPLLVKDPLEAKAMSGRLLEQGIFVQAIRPPTVPEGTSRLRLTVTAGHTKEDLDLLVSALRKM